MVDEVGVMSEAPFPVITDGYVPSSHTLDIVRGLGAWVRGASILTIAASVTAAVASFVLFQASLLAVLLITVALVVLGLFTLRLREVAAALDGIDRQPNALSTAFGLEAIARLFTMLAILTGLGSFGRLVALFGLLA